MMEEYSSRHESKVSLGASHGLAEYFEGNYDSLENFIDVADAMMYREKKKKRK